MSRVGRIANMSRCVGGGGRAKDWIHIAPKRMIKCSRDVDNGFESVLGEEKWVSGSMRTRNAMMTAQIRWALGWIISGTGEGIRFWS